MTSRRFSRFLDSLTREQKYVFYGSVLMSLGVLMPWYSDIDAFKTGDTFFGFTGPLYLIGVLLFIAGIACFSTLASRRVRDRMERVFSHLGDLYLMTAGFSLFLLVLANSVYFHPKFGVNIALKESRFGMTVTVVGAILLGIGGYFIRRRRDRRHEYDAQEIGHLEPLIHMPEISETPVVPEPRDASSRREHGSVISSPPPPPPPSEPSYARDQTLEEVMEDASHQSPLL